MDWQTFLNYLGWEVGLSKDEQSVFALLKENTKTTKTELLKRYRQLNGDIGDETFTQRLRGIYKKFIITEQSNDKISHLCRIVQERYDIDKQSRYNLHRFEMMGLDNIYEVFPLEIFKQKIKNLISLEDNTNKQIDILQTYAPNLIHIKDELSEALKNGIKLRVLLVWPYSKIARLREDALKLYSANNSTIEHQDLTELNIVNSVINNIEIFEQILKNNHLSKFLEIRLYDTLPSMSIYRVENYLLNASFLHGRLAINTFWLELDLVSQSFLTYTIQNEFEQIWQMAKQITPSHNQNWRNQIKILFNPNYV